MVRYTFAGPYRSHARAKQVLDDCIATGEVCEGERPQIEGRSLPACDGSGLKKRWFITLGGG